MLSLINLAVCFANPVEIPQRNLYVPSELAGQVRLVVNDKKFTILHNSGEQFPIESYNVRGLPKDMSNEQISTADLYFKLSIAGKNSCLEINSRLRGGGERLKSFWEKLTGPHPVSRERWENFKIWLAGPHPILRAVFDNAPKGIQVVKSIKN